MFFTGLLVGTANGLFGSGGGMICVPLLEKNGFDEKKSHASSIAVTVILSFVSTVVYFTKGNLEFSTALKFIPMGLVGAFIGAKLLKKMSGNTLRKIFGAVMITAGIRLLMKG